MTKKTIAIEEPTHDEFIAEQLRHSVRNSRKYNANSFMEELLMHWKLTYTDVFSNRKL